MESNTALDSRPANLLTVPDVKEILGIGTATLYRLIDSGQIKRVKVGSAARFRPSDIQEFIDRQVGA